MAFRRKVRPLRQEHYRWMRDGVPNFNDKVFQHVRELEVIAKKDIKWVSPTTSIMKAIELMSSSHRSLVVLSHGLFKGLLTAMNVINYLGGGGLFKIIADRHNYDIYSALNRESVESIMERSPVFVYIDEGVRETLNRMVLYGAGIVPVLGRDGRVYGIVTEHDFVKYLSGVLSIGLKVKDIMSAPVITVNEGATIKEAMETMVKFGFRRLPVTSSDNVIVGLVTALDIVKAFGTHLIMRTVRSRDARELVETPISEIMVRELAVVHPDEDLVAAINTMLSRDISSVLVADENGILLGILTERDVLYAILAPK